MITGATSGIGEHLAYLLAKKGIPLILSGRNLEKLEQMKKELNAVIIQADLGIQSDRDKVSALVKELSPDLIINNAGFAHYGEVMRFTTQQEMEIAEVNMMAVLQLTLDGAKAMKKGGVIVNIASAAAFQVIPNFAVYAATKAFVVNLSQALNEEFRPLNVSVLASCPGVVVTDFTRRASAGKVTSKQMDMAMDVDFAVNEIWKQIESRKPVQIFDWRYRLMTTLSKLLPQSIIFAFLRRSMGKRT